MEKLKEFARKNFNRPKQKENDPHLDHAKAEAAKADFNDSNLITHFKEEKFSFPAWRIENIQLCTLQCQQFLESDVYYTTFGEKIKWSLRLYPKGRKFPTRSCCHRHYSFDHSSCIDCVKVGLFVHKVSKKFAKSSFKYRLTCERYVTEDDASKVKFTYSYPKEGEDEMKMDLISSLDHGTDDLYCPDEFSKRSETLVVKCDIYVTNVYTERVPRNHVPDLSKSCTLFKDLKKMCRNGKFSDVTLQAKDVKFPAHKAILASRSKVFEYMFQEARPEAVLIDNIEPAVLCSLLQYIYTGSVEDFNFDKAMSLYAIADTYMLEELKNWCAVIMSANMRVNNVCKIALLADQHSDPILKEATFNMFRKYTNEIFERKEFQDLLDNSKHLASEILRAVSTAHTTNCENN